MITTKRLIKIWFWLHVRSFDITDRVYWNDENLKIAFIDNNGTIEDIRNTLHCGNIFALHYYSVGNRITYWEYHTDSFKDLMFPDEQSLQQFLRKQITALRDTKTRQFAI